MMPLVTVTVVTFVSIFLCAYILAGLRFRSAFFDIKMQPVTPTKFDSKMTTKLPSDTISESVHTISNPQSGNLK